MQRQTLADMRGWKRSTEDSFRSAHFKQTPENKKGSQLPIWLNANTFIKHSADEMLVMLILFTYTEKATNWDGSQWSNSHPTTFWSIVRLTSSRSLNKFFLFFKQ